MAQDAIWRLTRSSSCAKSVLSNFQWKIVFFVLSFVFEVDYIFRQAFHRYQTIVSF